jgi:hypothetical protein
MRRWAILLTVTALAAGCGDDDDGDETGSTTAPAAPPTQQRETTEPSAAPERSELEKCLADADLEVKPGTEKAADGRTRQPLSDAKQAYLGYVQWPSKHIADVYLAKDAAEAGTIESEAQGFVKAFGLDPAKYVRRANTVVLTFDDPPPTADEAKAVEDCATG